MNEELKRNYSVIATIKKGKAERIWEAPKEAGAEGATTLLAKVTSMKELKKLSGSSLDEDREVMTVVKKEWEEDVFETISDKCEFNKPGTGIAFIMDLKKVEGIEFVKGGLLND